MSNTIYFPAVGYLLNPFGRMRSGIIALKQAINPPTTFFTAKRAALAEVDVSTIKNILFCYKVALFEKSSSQSDHAHSSTIF